MKKIRHYAWFGDTFTLAASTLKYARIVHRARSAGLRRKRRAMNSPSDWVTLVASIGIISLAVFQMLLAAGLPYGAAAFGGTNTVLPSRLRLASAISAVLFWVALYVALYVALAEGGLFGASGRSTFVRITVWIFVAIFGLSGIANIASRSRWERNLMAPVALVLATCFAVLALVQ